MAIFVEHKESGGLYVLISGGFGIYQSAANGVFDQMKLYEQGTRLKICVCDQNGDIGWFNSEEIRVINVDGIDIKELKDLAKFT